MTTHKGDCRHEIKRRLLLGRKVMTNLDSMLKSRDIGERSQDGRGVGRGEHFLPHKFIKRAFKCRVNSTKQLLNAGRGHQAPRKATHCLQKEVGKNIKDKKKEPKEGGTEFLPGKGVLKREKFPNTRKPSHCGICAKPWKHRGQHNREEK